jgi:hypothetical protein
MGKFDSFFESLNISESSLQSIKKTENNLIQTPVYTFVTPYLFYTYTFYIIIRIPCIENTQISRKTRLNYQYLMGKKSCFEKRWKFWSSYVSRRWHILRGSIANSRPAVENYLYTRCVLYCHFIEQNIDNYVWRF